MKMTMRVTVEVKWIWKPSKQRGRLRRPRSCCLRKPNLSSTEGLRPPQAKKAHLSSIWTTFRKRHAGSSRISRLRRGPSVTRTKTRVKCGARKLLGTLTMNELKLAPK